MAHCYDGRPLPPSGELLPCPDCGGTNLERSCNGWAYSVHCPDCYDDASC